MSEKQIWREIHSRAAAFPRGQSDAVVRQFFRDVGATYLVVDSGYRRDHEQAAPFVSRNRWMLTSVFANRRFTVFTVRPER